MIFRRNLYDTLLKWKLRQNRKPLLIRGARQVGKSTLVRAFADEFDHFIEINFEKEEHKKLFNDIDKVNEIADVLLLKNEIHSNGNKILIFFDEIQECPKAIQKLRYFYEELPDLYIIAAGSLLEFALKEISSFPVGRIEQIVLHPFDFDEFLSANNKTLALKELEKTPVNSHVHSVLLDLFHKYTILGGMPEIIQNYVAGQSYAELSTIYQNLWQSYIDDIEKYASNFTERKVIRHIIHTAPAEKDRITFNGFGNSNYRSREVGEAFRALDLARLIHLVYPCTEVTPPITANLRRKPRLQFLDTGLLNFAVGIQAELIGVNDLNKFYKGKIIQQIVTQQIQAQMVSPLYRPHFWVREKANSNAEVDLVYQYNQYIIPIELKFGKHGGLKSLHQFVNRCNHKFAIRMLANKLSVEKNKTPEGKEYWLLNMPYYLSTKTEKYIEWFVNEYKTF